MKRVAEKTKPKTPLAKPTKPPAGRLEPAHQRDQIHARQWTRRRGRPPRPDTTVIAVTDDGRGIAKEFLPHVFDRFRQAEGGSTRAHGGLGIGLTIVKNLVELPGGTIRAESDGDGRGSRFVVSLPTLRALGQAERHIVTPTRGFEVDRTLAGVRLLVVDDDPDGREVIAELLRGFHADDRKRALRAGFDGHVTKPINPHELFLVLASFLQQASTATSVVGVEE
ncbi:hypothetical protein BH09MYX1_BH09MYX1_22430 [soil metagenome]